MKPGEIHAYFQPEIGWKIEWDDLSIWALL
jgi:hypothetical protein